MAYGTANVDVIQSSAANTPVQFNDGNGTQVGTLCRAWGSYAFVGAGSVPTLRLAFNISSITRNSTGNYTFAFTTALPDSNYSVVPNANQGSTTSNQSLAFSTAKSTSSFTVQCVYPASPTAYDFGIDFVVNR